MAIVTSVFPEDSQKHLLVYYDPSIQTLNEGLRRLMRVSNPILRYTQSISIAQPTTDRSYDAYVVHHKDVGIFHLSFPDECTMIGHVRNNRGCRMVSYYRDPNNGYVREWTVTKKDMIRNVRGLELVVYTNHHRDLVITFDVFMFKPSVKSAL